MQGLINLFSNQGQQQQQQQEHEKLEQRWQIYLQRKERAQQISIGGGYFFPSSDELAEPLIPFDSDEPLERPDTVAAVKSVVEAGGGDGPLSMAARVEYSSLQRGESRDVFGLISVQAMDVTSLPSGVEQTRQPMDLVCVLDVSASMGGAKIEQLKEAMNFVVRQSASNDRISLVPFNSTARLTMPLKGMTPDGKEAANTAVQQLRSGGGTHIAAGLDVALCVMEQRRERNKVAAILVLTDGQDSRTKSQLPSLLERASLCGCAVYAFGFGSDHDAALLGELSERARTPFTFVEDTSNISEAFAGCFGGLSSIVAQNVKVTMDCAVQLKEAHTPFAVRRDGSKVEITIPDVFAGECRDILVELLVPAETEATTLLSASIQYTDLWRSVTVQGSPVEMTLERVDEPQPEMEPDEQVSDHRRRVEVRQALQDASSRGEGGDFESAQSVLQAAEQKLSASKKKSQLVLSLGQELADAKERMKSRATWEHGGRAEVRDAMQMHSVQRSNMISSNKSSRSMYLSFTQRDYVAWSRTSDNP